MITEAQHDANSTLVELLEKVISGLPDQLVGPCLEHVLAKLIAKRAGKLTPEFVEEIEDALGIVFDRYSRGMQ